MVTRNELMKKCGLIGSGVGVVLFAVFGLLQGALLGGAAGLAIANHVFGETTLELMANELLPRMIVAGSMLAGVIFSLVFFTVTGAAMGVAGGFVLSLTQAHAKTSELSGELAAEAVKNNN